LSDGEKSTKRSPEIVSVLNVRAEWIYIYIYKVVKIWPGLFVCKQVTVCPGHIWTTLYIYVCVCVYTGNLSRYFLVITSIMWQGSTQSVHFPKPAFYTYFFDPGYSQLPHIMFPWQYWTVNSTQFVACLSYFDRKTMLVKSYLCVSPDTSVIYTKLDLNHLRALHVSKPPAFMISKYSCPYTFTVQSRLSGFTCVTLWSCSIVSVYVAVFFTLNMTTT
jgi:hypothetical protein